MTHKITITFEVDASNWQYPLENKSLEQNIKTDLSDLDALIGVLDNADYHVQVEKLEGFK